MEIPASSVRQLTAPAVIVRFRGYFNSVPVLARGAACLMPGIRARVPAWLISQKAMVCKAGNPLSPSDSEPEVAPDDFFPQRWVSSFPAGISGWTVVPAMKMMKACSYRSPDCASRIDPAQVAQPPLCRIWHPGWSAP